MNVTLDALQQPVAGIVTAISPQADAKSRVFSVDLTIANPRNQVRPGMIGSLSLAADARPVRTSRNSGQRMSCGLRTVRIALQSFASKRVAATITRPRSRFKSATLYGNAIEVTGGVA